MSVHISGRAAAQLRAGHLWVYRSELREADTAALTPGTLVDVLDPTGRPIGTALYSSTSQIALRLVSNEPLPDRAAWLTLLQQRVGAALARRRIFAPLREHGEDTTNAQRLVFSEADALPGIVVDRYAELVIVQLLTQGTAQADVRAALVEILAAELAPSGQPLTLWERPDPRILELEQLPAPSPEPLWHRGEATSATHFTLNGLRFEYNVLAGQKTGAFLDQRLNYLAAAECVQRSGRTGHALDVCTYQGGFALHLARVCARVTGVDQSRTALQTADRNLGNNPLVGRVDWIEADAFELLRALEEAARRDRRQAGIAGLPSQFDAIVLDPPAFTKSRRAAEGALRGYKELNLRAMRMLAPGGTLVTCSCSHHVSLEAFTQAITEAAADAGRRVQLLEQRIAAPDHPEVLTLPETRYLKCLLCRVE